MSKWTHIAGIVRIDHMAVKRPQMTEEEVIALFSEDAPSGSEGGLKFYAVRTQVITPSGYEVVWGYVAFTGDLRGFDDTKKCEEWLKSTPLKLKEHQSLVRQGAISVDVEYGPCISIIWNTRTDEWTIIDVPP